MSSGKEESKATGKQDSSKPSASNSSSSQKAEKGKSAEKMNASSSASASASASSSASASAKKEEEDCALEAQKKLMAKRRLMAADSAADKSPKKAKKKGRFGATAKSDSDDEFVPGSSSEDGGDDEKGDGSDEEEEDDDDLGEGSDGDFRERERSAMERRLKQMRVPVIEDLLDMLEVEQKDTSIFTAKQWTQFGDMIEEFTNDERLAARAHKIGISCSRKKKEKLKEKGSAVKRKI